MNVSLGKIWEQYVADQIESGLFGNASEVVRDALRRQQEHFLKLEALRCDVQAGAGLVAGRARQPVFARGHHPQGRGTAADGMSGYVLSSDADEDLQAIYAFRCRCGAAAKPRSASTRSTIPSSASPACRRSGASELGEDVRSVPHGLM